MHRSSFKASPYKAESLAQKQRHQGQACTDAGHHQGVFLETCGVEPVGLVDERQAEAKKQIPTQGEKTSQQTAGMLRILFLPGRLADPFEKK